MDIVTDKPLRIATLTGAVISFEAGKPLTVSEEIGLLAMQEGAKQLQPSAAISEPAPDRKELELELVLAAMMEKGSPADFKADGYPKAAAVNKAMGRTVSTDERTAAWESVLNS